MKHEFLDHHRTGNSIIHLADPRLKIIMMVFYIMVVVAIPSNAHKYYIHLLLIGILIALISGVPLLHYFTKLIKIYSMVLLVFIFIPFFPSGPENYYLLGKLKIYPSGLNKFIQINIKTILIIFISIILTTTTDFMRLLKGLEKLKVPQVTLTILSFMYRFIFLIIDEIERMMMAFRSRYIKLSYLNKIRIFTKQIGVLFLRTYQRGERIYQAMESRGFYGKIYIMDDLFWQKKDNYLLIVFILLLFLPIFLLSL
jgi:cobalt/nickel transport system permease protein